MLKRQHTVHGVALLIQSAVEAAGLLLYGAANAPHALVQLRIGIAIGMNEDADFGECTKDGEYYGYAVLARKIGQIIHDTVEVDTSGATEPVFGKTLF